MKKFKKPGVGALVLTALVCLTSTAVHAQAFRCKQANGAMAFQDRPCTEGSVGSAMSLPTPASGRESAPSAGPSNNAAARSQRRVPGQESERDAAQRRADDDIAARNAQNEAYNKGIRCNRARQQLGLAKEPGAIYRRDNAGNRIYVEDNERASVIARAEREVVRECR